jgi:hypothetical protein
VAEFQDDEAGSGFMVVINVEGLRLFYALGHLPWREAGFDRHLVKPVGRATLEELVKSAAEGR